MIKEKLSVPAQWRECCHNVAYSDCSMLNAITIETAIAVLGQCFRHKWLPVVGLYQAASDYMEVCGLCEDDGMENGEWRHCYVRLTSSLYG